MSERVPFLSERTESEIALTDAQRLDLAEHEWQAWKQIAHEYWLEIQHLRRILAAAPIPVNEEGST